MSQSVSEALVDVSRSVAVVVNDVVRRRGNGALERSLRNQEEFEPVGQRHRIVDNESGRRIFVTDEKTGRDPFRYQDICDSRSVWLL